jgi:hypothetical protein
MDKDKSGELVETLIELFNKLAEEEEKEFKDCERDKCFDEARKHRHSARVDKFISDKLNQGNQEMRDRLEAIIKKEYSELYIEAAIKEVLNDCGNNNDVQTSLMM